MLTKVVNLKTGKELFYSLPPEEAVVCAFMQEKGSFNTFEYDYTIARLSNSRKTVNCGDFASAMEKKGDVAK